MKNITGHKGILKMVKRMNNSRMGNPQFMLECDGYKFRTQANSMQAFGIEFYVGKEVIVYIGTHRNCLTLDSIHSA